MSGGVNMEEFFAAGKRFPLNRTYVMGILNVTPDSFSDGGLYLDPAAAAVSYTHLTLPTT